MHDFVNEDIRMNGGYFGRLRMDHQFNGYTPYFYAPSGHQLTAMQPAPQVVPMFMPCIQKPDIVPVPKSSKSFSIEDILRRPHPSTCMVDRSFLSGIGEVAGRVDYRFGQVPYHWERGMWHSGLPERFTGTIVQVLHL